MINLKEIMIKLVEKKNSKRIAKFMQYYETELLFDNITEFDVNQYRWFYYIEDLNLVIDYSEENMYHMKPEVKVIYNSNIDFILKEIVNSFMDNLMGNISASKKEIIKLIEEYKEK